MSYRTGMKRGFLPRPEKKLYTKNQFCRVAIISALRESMQIDRITSLLSYINGHLDDERDDLVSDAELYNDFVNLIIACGGFRSPREIRIVIDELTADYKEPYAGARKKAFQSAGGYALRVYGRRIPLDGGEPDGRFRLSESSAPDGCQVYERTVEF